MKYANFLQELKLLNPNAYVQIATGFGEWVNNYGYIPSKFSNTKVDVITDDYSLDKNSFNLEFRVIDSNYSNKKLTVDYLILSLDLKNKFEIARVTIYPEPFQTFQKMPWPYFDIFTNGNCELKIKVIDDELVEIYLDHLSK